MSNYTPTDEQQAAVDAAQTGENVVLKAGAGSGKTSTLVNIAEALSRKRIAYVAFNKDIAEEATHKMPANVEAKTASAFAYRGTIIFPKSAWGERFTPATSSAVEYAQALSIKQGKEFDASSEEAVSATFLKVSTLGYIVRGTIDKFCTSAEDEIQGWMVPKQDGLSKAGQATLAAYILPLANKVWADLNNVKGDLVKFTFGHYLKQFQLSGQPIKVKLDGSKAMPAEVILFDEAQDASPVIRAIVQQQKVQVIAVGDENQAIYGFTGAVNALDAFDAPHVLKLTKSFRFGPAIANTANLLLAKLDTDMRIVGHDPVPSEVVL
jgi:superfamily I DNA/RNA helicase